MTGPLNPHQAFDRYQVDGTAAVDGQPAHVQLDLARTLNSEVLPTMDQNSRVAGIVRRDIAELYARAHPEEQPASDWQRQEAQRTIDALKADPAYADATHPQHEAVTKRIQAAYATRCRGQG